jgi:hypothetical protein
MSLEGKKDKIFVEYVPCAGVKGNLKRENCLKCDHYAGLKTVPIKNFMDKDSQVIRVDEYILCKYPKELPVQIVKDMEG